MSVIQDAVLEARLALATLMVEVAIDDLDADENRTVWKFMDLLTKIESIGMMREVEGS